MNRILGFCGHNKNNRYSKEKRGWMGWDGDAIWGQDMQRICKPQKQMLHLCWKAANFVPTTMRTTWKRTKTTIDMAKWQKFNMDPHLLPTYCPHEGHLCIPLKAVFPFPFHQTPYEQKKCAQNKRQNNRAQCIGNEPRQKAVSWPCLCIYVYVCVFVWVWQSLRLLSMKLWPWDRTQCKGRWTWIESEVESEFEFEFESEARLSRQR